MKKNFFIVLLIISILDGGLGYTMNYEIEWWHSIVAVILSYLIAHFITMSFYNVKILFFKEEMVHSLATIAKGDLKSDVYAYFSDGVFDEWNERYNVIEKPPSWNQLIYFLNKKENEVEIFMSQSDTETKEFIEIYDEKKEIYLIMRKKIF